MTQNTSIVSGGQKEHRLISYIASAGLAISIVLIASGITKNDIAYIFLVPIFFFLIPLAKIKYSTSRKAMIALSVSMVAFGTIKGYFVGHEINYILRFTLPLLTFAIACLFPGIGATLYQRRSLILFLSFFYTMFVLFTVKTGNFLFAERFFPGWTLTFSSFEAVSVWHFFALPFCFASIGRIANDKLGIASLTNSITAIATIVALYLLTDTSSYVLAVLAIILLMLLPMTILNWARIIAYIVLAVTILDFLTVKVIANMILEFMYRLGIEDMGDILRLIQLDYFVHYAEFFGSGFGAEHAFPLEMQFQRQVSQIVYPYASELPIINIIYNGGILAGIWFFWLSITVIDLARFRKIDKGVGTFGLACSGILFGSTSNPYLFAPASMLLLAMMFDIWERHRNSAKASNPPRRGARRTPRLLQYRP